MTSNLPFYNGFNKTGLSAIILGYFSKKKKMFTINILADSYATSYWLLIFLDLKLSDRKKLFTFHNLKKKKRKEVSQPDWSVSFGQGFLIYFQNFANNHFPVDIVELLFHISWLMKMNSHLLSFYHWQFLNVKVKNFHFFLPNKLLFENLRPLFSKTTFLPERSEKRDEHSNTFVFQCTYITN